MNLRLLGLTEYEGKAYTALVKLGKSKASVIAREGNISYGKIYDILASLELKGLVSIIPEKTKLFVASNPGNLIKLIHNTEKEISKTKKEVLDLKQIYKDTKEDSVLVFRGKNTFYKVNRMVPEVKKYEYTIKYNFEYRPEFVRGVTRQLRQQKEYKVIGRIDDRTNENIAKWKKEMKQRKLPYTIKPINNNGVGVSIMDDRIVQIILINANTSVIINDPAFAEVMKQLYLGYYAGKP